jgi:DNA-binding beta-propeller fold protein YncE
MIVKQFNLFINYTLSKKIISSNIITSLIAILIITILNSLNLFTDQIVYAQTVIDTLKVGDYPVAIKFNPTKGEMYVLNGHDKSISIISIYDKKDIKEILNISKSPIALAFDSFSNHLYVVDGLEPIVTVIDISNNSIIDRLNITSPSKDIIYDPKYKIMYTLPSEDNGTVKMIKTSTKDVQDFVKISDTPRAIGFDSINDHLYILNQSLASSNGTITIINTTNKTFFDPIDIGPSGSYNNFAFDPIHGHMYMTSASKSKLHIIDANTRTIIDILDRTSGLDFPLRMDLDKFSGKMYIANAGSNIFIINTNNRAQYSNFPIGNGYEPVDVAFDSIHKYIYIVNKDKDSVTIIHPLNVSPIGDSVETVDYFGRASGSGDFNHDGYDDLVLGTSFEDITGLSNAGAVSVLYGTGVGLKSISNQLWDQNYPNILDTVESRDYFGSTIATGDFNHDGYDDLAIGVPGEDLGTIVNAGAVNVIYGSNTGLNANTVPNQFWHQDSTNILDAAEYQDILTEDFSLVCNDFNNDGNDDLAIGVGWEDIVSIVDAGAVNVIYGSNTGLNANTVPNQFWHQDS